MFGSDALGDVRLCMTEQFLEKEGGGALGLSALGLASLDSETRGRQGYLRLQFLTLLGL